MSDELIESRIEEAIISSGQKKATVVYSAYTEDEDEEPIDNLDEVAVKGKCIFYAPVNTFFGGRSSKIYLSPIVENPTWLQVCVMANAMISKTRDTHHCFLEGVKPNTEEIKLNLPDDVKVYRFCMGS